MHPSSFCALYTPWTSPPPPALNLPTCRPAGVGRRISRPRSASRTSPLSWTSCPPPAPLLLPFSSPPLQHFLLSTFSSLPAPDRYDRANGKCWDYTKCECKCTTSGDTFMTDTTKGYGFTGYGYFVNGQASAAAGRAVLAPNCSCISPPPPPPPPPYHLSLPTLIRSRAATAIPFGAWLSSPASCSGSNLPRHTPQ